MIRRGWSIGLVLALAFFLAPEAALAQGSGVVAGRVQDTSMGPLEGASVQVEGTRLETWTDATGRFRLAGVPAGKRTIVVSFVGFTEKAEVDVTAGGTAEAAFKIELRFTESVTVSQPLLEGQARALAQQQAAPGIASFVGGRPDSRRFPTRTSPRSPSVSPASPSSVTTVKGRTWSFAGWIPG